MSCILFLTKIQDLGAIPGPAENSVLLIHIVYSHYLVPLNPGFLNKCCIYLPWSKFLTEECCCSLVIMQINLNEFTFWEHLVPICSRPLLDAQRSWVCWSSISLGWFANLACPVLRKPRQVPLYNRVPAFDRHKNIRVLCGALRGSLVALLSPPQCHTALSMMPYILAWVNLCPC